MINFTGFTKHLVPVFSLLSIVGKAQQPAALQNPYPSGMPVNYVRAWQAIKPERNTSNISTASAPSEHRLTTSYFDGMGRELQTVVKQGSLSSFSGTNITVDLVSPRLYDVYGRESMKYLPFAAASSDGKFKMSPFQQQATFYNSELAGQAGETNIGPDNLNWAYAYQQMELSQQSRLSEQFAPGASWMGSQSQATEAARRSVKIKYCLNTAVDQVVQWDVISPAGFYAANQLYKTISIDEHNKQVIEFKDNQGKLILKKAQLTGPPDAGSGAGYAGWLCTYYIYDNWNMLTHVIQPVGVNTLSENNWPTQVSAPTLWSTLLDEQIFVYQYDERNRMISKKVPGSGVMQMIYDARDRLVLTQDANLRAAQQWLYTKYDDFNRPVATGIITDPANYNNPNWHHNEASTNSPYPPIADYTSVTLTETFYDNYNWLTNHGSPFSQTMDGSFNSLLLPASDVTYPYPQSLTQSFRTSGLVTGTRTRVMGTGQYLYSINYYDEKNRLIQQVSQNITGGIFRFTTQYSFAGSVLQSLAFTKNGNGGDGQEFTVHTRNTLDPLGRVVSVSQELYTFTGVGNTGEKNVVTFAYDAMGRVRKKVLAPYMNSGSGLETQIMDYNIRDWSLGVNRTYLDGTSSAFFGYELGYDKLPNKAGKDFNAGAHNGEFNGNINGVVWKSKGDGTLRKYDYEYDAANRLMKGDFEQRETNGTWDATSVNFKVQMGDGVTPASAYDANGNILSMKQYGWKLGGGNNPIDDLEFNYLPGSNRNRLHYVRDLQDDPNTKLGDFHDGTNAIGTADYAYDGNGNITLDLNKNISQITYNHLNLPETVTVLGKGTITYTYDAVGTKLKKQVVDQTVTPNVVTTTLYLGNVVFTNNQIAYLQHSEGRIRYVDASSSTCPPLPSRFVFDYFIKDHLGNVRMNLTDQQQNTCYIAATAEDSRYSAESQIYEINNARRIDKVIAGAGAQSSFENKVYRVHGGLTGEKTGLAMTLKVMSGDQVKIYAESFYSMPGGGPGGSAGLGLSELLTSFVNSNTLLAAGHGGIGTSAVTNAGSNMSSIPNHLTQQSEGSNNARAFVNWILFDEQFKFVAGSVDEVKPGGGFKQHSKFINQPVTVTKNGFLYIYVSNESNLPVYFDNLAVTHVPGVLLEESHYYPFGLTMAGISSKALQFGGSENKRGITGKELQYKEFSDYSGIDLYDFGARYYDHQVGRWHTQDPHSENYFSWSPYNYVGNNPINIVDLDGKDWFQDKNGNVIWNDSRAATLSLNKVEYGNIGSTLTMQVVSYIHDEHDVAAGAAGTKLTNTYTITGNYDKDGKFSGFTSEFSRVTGKSWGAIGGTDGVDGQMNIGKPIQKLSDGSYTGGFEQHTALHPIVGFFMEALHGRKVDVTNDLRVNIAKDGKMTAYIGHGTFPSIEMTVNGDKQYEYRQHSFLLSHSQFTNPTSKSYSAELVEMGRKFQVISDNVNLINRAKQSEYIKFVGFSSQPVNPKTYSKISW